MNALEFVVLVLATWRLVRLVQNERGPFAVFTRIRARCGVEHDAEGQPVGWPDTELGRLLGCGLCGSVWAGLGLVGLYLWSAELAFLVALPFAVSAGAVVMGWLEVNHGQS